MTLNTHPSSSSEVKERVELYIYLLFGTSWQVIGRTFIELEGALPYPQ
jgi:hypothetical protein